MLQATLLQACLQSQANRAGSPRAKQNSHSFLKPKSDSRDGYGCSGRLQGKEKESSPRHLQVAKSFPANPKAQEMKESPSEDVLGGSWRANGEVLPSSRDSGGLARGGCPVTRDPPSSASELLPSGLSNRADQSQEWKVVKVKRVLISPVGEPRKPNISRSASLSEKELKEAKARSQRIAAQLTTPPNTNSKGVLLFHRRKQRVNAFTLETPKPASTEQTARENGPQAAACHSIPSHGKESCLKQAFGDNQELKGLSGAKDSRRWVPKSPMEKYKENLAVDNAQGLPTMTTLSSTENSAEEFEPMPLSVYLKETTGTASTNGVHECTTNKFENAPVHEQVSVFDNTENMPPLVDDTPVADRENNSNVLEKEPHLLEADRVNNILEKEPCLLGIGSENNNNIPIKEPYIPLIDRENNFILDKALSEPIVDRRENGEVLGKETDLLLPENKNLSTTSDTEKPALVKDVQPNEIMTHSADKHYCEVRLTLSKPKPVKNRTARPFGTQSSRTSQTPPAANKSPVVEFPPPPTYAETFSSPPPVTRVRSPPAYSALYPSEEQKDPVPQAPLVEASVPQPPVPQAAVLHVPIPQASLPEVSLQHTKREESRPGSLPEESRESPPTKTGILEESAARRAAKKSMFTFVEKPKVAPNPDLLNLVQRADNWKKQRGQRGAIPEDEPFVLGAEASNFLSESRSIEEPTQAPADSAPEWSSCLRSPRIQPKPKIRSNQSLSEARGKGAELFAKRQSRMQKYIIESPSHPDTARSPSPTMSLPPSWKYASETHLSAMSFQPPPRSPARSPKAPHVPLYNSSMSEGEVSKKELEVSKQQPYQLQPSLFILSPVKDPVGSLPKAAPPPKATVPEPGYMRQASCPTSPLLPSPVFHPPVQSSPSTSLPGLFPSPSGTMLVPQNVRTSVEASPESTFEYSSRILSPRAKGVFQAPRPSYSTKNAGIEPQERKASLPASPTWTPRLLRRQPSSLDGWVSPAPTPEPEEGLADAFRAASVLTPPPPMSPSWSERSLSPFRQETDPKSSRQMQALLARNIINAARRKSSSPKATGAETFRPFTPPVTSANASSSSGGSPKSVGNPSPSPLQSPRPMRMDGFRRVSLPTAMPPVSASSNNSPRLLGSQSPTYKSPLQSPKAGRMNGSKYFTLPANTGASLFGAGASVMVASHNGPRTTGPHSVAQRDPVQSPKHTIMDSHRIFTPPAGPSRKSSCTSPKNLGTCSPTVKNPLQSSTMSIPSPEKRYTSMSPTNSDASLDFEDSGIKSPSIRSFNICPRGWNGSLRLKRGSLPAEAPCT
uniref:Synaptopodin n=1 Tax=Pogona vitticeps TaxID=103695 RepID=A0A6J0UP34_9SAUR